MRSIWFSLIGPDLAGVESRLQSHGLASLDGEPGHFVYPSEDDPVLYVSCGGYDWVQEYGLQEEYDELLQAIGGGTPTVHVLAHVSGRVPGDQEVRFLARCLLGAFRGFAFDDFLSYSHAWTLAEIESGALVDGLGFFDYQGDFNRSRSPSKPSSSI